jgi:hypothetical protein
MVFVFVPDTVNEIGVGLVSPTAELGVAPGAMVMVQLEPGARTPAHVLLDTLVPAGSPVAEGKTSLAAVVPVFVIRMTRGVPVKSVDVAVSLTLSANEDTLAEIVVFTTITVKVSGLEVIEPRAASICVLPAVSAVTKPLLPEALLTVAVPGVPDVHVTVPVMSWVE